MTFAYILIIVLGGYNPVIQQEFSSFETCEEARFGVINSIRKQNYVSVISQGCYRK